MLKDTQASSPVKPTHFVVTSRSLSLVMAYVHRHAPARLRQRRLVAASHLQSMSAWIGAPRPHLRVLRRHKLLAAHLTLLRAADLLSVSGSFLALQPAAPEWLFAARDEQVRQLLAALSSPAWEETVAHMRLESALTIDYTAYLRQTLSRQLGSAPQVALSPARWLPGDDGDEWRLKVAAPLPPYLMFDLLQLGDWSPQDDVLELTALTVAVSVQRGYRLPYVRRLLEKVTEEPLPLDRRRQLEAWAKRGNAYRMETAHLLSTDRPEDLRNILDQRRMRPHVTRQLGPRHALVAAEGIASLQRWLARQGYPLDLKAAALSPAGDDEALAAESDAAAAAYQWLGLRLLMALGELIPLPYALPYSFLDGLSGQLSETERSEMDALCEEIVDRLRQAISGRDAFFPADRCPSPGLLRQINSALSEEKLLEIVYQGLGEAEPRQRRIHPLRLEQRGRLYYLHAYCTLAQAERTFRLDRVHACNFA